MLVIISHIISCTIGVLTPCYDHDDDDNDNYDDDDDDDDNDDDDDDDDNDNDNDDSMHFFLSFNWPRAHHLTRK